MSLSAGTRLGPYEILSLLGSGGMGEVYRARDTKLGREVAIKVLPESVAVEPERLVRFSREAQLLAALNHPNIAHIHGFEESTGVPALVMELVEGPTLAERVARGPIPIDEALPIAKQIAEALEAAHEQGIIHRDLKPTNIKVRDDGTVKVLDFGLAKAMESSEVSRLGPGELGLTQSPTITTPAMMTGVGVILGTAAYMSPEQARGRTADKRSDVWAFGCVLYEMLTASRAFGGEDITDVLATVLKSEPDWSAIPTSVPPHVCALVRHCLVKDRRARIADVSTARFVLDGALEATIPRAAPARIPSGWSSLVLRVSTALLAVTTVAGFVAAWLAQSATPSVTRFQILPADGTSFIVNGRPAASATISPDGRLVAFTARDASGRAQLWIRPIDSLTARPLTGTDDAVFPFWSPDSRYIAYMVPTKLMKIAVAGGPPQTICPLKTNIGRGGAWSRNGVIVFNGGPAALLRVSASGGEATAISGSLGAGGLFPSFLPDGRHVLLFMSSDSSIYAVSVDDGQGKRIVEADSSGVFDVRSGRLLFVRQGTLMAQSFDAKTLSVSDEAIPVAEPVEANAYPGFLSFSLSDTGVIAYGGGSAATGLQLTWVDRQGKTLGTVGPVANYRGIDLSPDGTRVAAFRYDNRGGDVWLTDVSRGTTSRFTFDASQINLSPIWSPDGSLIAFGSLRAGKWGLYLKPSNGSGNEEQILEAHDVQVRPESWSPDGRSIAAGGARLRSDLFTLPLTGDREPVPLVRSQFGKSHGQISPDGKWFAYRSNESGSNEIYVQPFPAGDGRWQVSTSGGQLPRWRRDSRELFFMSALSRGKMMAVDIRASGTGIQPGAPREMFDTGYTNLGSASPYHAYAVSADGQRFLIPRPPSTAAIETSQPIVVVTNWEAALRR